MKNVRNNLITSDLEFDGNKVAEWSNLIEFFKLDESLFQMSSLTYKHLNPIGKAMMKVKPAAEVLGETVMKSILSIYRVTEKTKLTQCVDFANLCEYIDKFFDLTNGPANFQEKRKKINRTNVTEKSIHHKEWPAMINTLDTFTFICNLILVLILC